MQKHTKTYYKFFDIADEDTVLCEVCNAKAVDIHHIIPRSSFGTKTKDQQDIIENLIALCRDCHDKAHNELLTKEFLSYKHTQHIESKVDYDINNYQFDMVF